MAADGSDTTDRAEADHWRAVAIERSEELRRLKRRPLVRVALSLDRRLEPVRHAVGARSPVWRVVASRAAVTLAAIPSTAGRGQRRAGVAAAMAQFDATTQTAREISIIPLKADGSDRAASLAGAAKASPGELLCFAPGGALANDAWVARLAGQVGHGIVAATPTLIHPERHGAQVTEHDLRVRSRGFDVELCGSGSPVAVARGAGADVSADPAVNDVGAASLMGLVVERNAYEAAGGLATLAGDDDLDLAGIDLCTRLREAGGRVVHVGSAVIVDERPVRSRRALRRPVDISSPAWRGFVERHGPAAVDLHRGEGVDSSLRWVITTGATSPKIAARWGDSHLARDLANALRRCGEDVEVQTLDRADSLASRARDIHLVLHGLAPVRRTPGQRHLIWVISHPETLEPEECDAADLIVVASERFAASLRARTSTPVEVMLQASDPERFRPGAVDPAFRHSVTVVAKTRDVMRPIVADAISAGISPAIYGSGWRHLVDPSLVVAEYVPNDRLPVVYRSAGLVLNDHWDTMRAWGFVSNRIFDVLACGTPIISDDLPEVRRLFGDAVPTYTSVDELGSLVRQALDDPVRARANAQRGRQEVLAHHTFDHRARELLGLLDRHGLRPGVA